jgi:hypothetical protein
MKSPLSISRTIQLNKMGVRRTPTRNKTRLDLQKKMAKTNVFYFDKN